MTGWSFSLERSSEMMLCEEGAEEQSFSKNRIMALFSAVMSLAIHNKPKSCLNYSIFYMLFILYYIPFFMCNQIRISMMSNVSCYA